jgi:hypothetical protein
MKVHVTDLMFETLSRLRQAPQKMLDMEPREKNRAYALLDKRLLKIRYGKAMPTVAGMELLERKGARK